MIHIVAILTAKMGHRGSLLAALQSVVPAVRAEPGCLEYQPSSTWTNRRSSSARTRWW